MKKSFILLGLISVFGVAALPEIPYTEYRLDNGLRLVVHENHKAPVVAINVWYAVGSRDENLGRTGFAHLFEHLMFNGTENFNDEYFVPLESIGATDLNGTTNSDRTNYFQTVPKNALDTVLWMESDRMGHLLGVIDQARLDEQRGVVQNEKRQGENRPYGKVWERVAKSTFPYGHPYSWTTIGLMQDLNAATLDDVHQWFKNYYGPNNATIVLAGDIKPEVALEKVQKYFGHIPASNPRARLASRVPKLRNRVEDVMYDQVPQARTYWVWNVPELTAKDAPAFEILASILGGGKNSRLSKRLVHELQIASDVGAFYFGRQLSGQLWVYATANPGEDLDRIKQEIQKIINGLTGRGNLLPRWLGRLVSPAVSNEELAIVTSEYESELVFLLERMGGFGGVSDMLASSAVYADDPGSWREYVQKAIGTSSADLQRIARIWLKPQVYILDVYPYSEYTNVAQSQVSRDKLPESGKPPTLTLPEFKAFELNNGVPVVLAERRAIPTFEIEFQFDAGHAADDANGAGVGSFAVSMLTRGSEGEDALAVDRKLSLLGASANSDSRLDTSFLRISGLRDSLDETISLAVGMLTQPNFDADEIERLRTQWLASIDQEAADPASVALRTLPQLLYGEGHPYGKPFTGSGYKSVINQLTREDLLAFRARWLRPENLSIVAVGDVGKDELHRALEKTLSGWQSEGEAGVKQIPKAQVQPSHVYLIDRPQAQQSYILAGELLPGINTADAGAVDASNHIVGGSFTARLNMNLREDKHWSYGARSRVIDTRGQRPMIVFAPVQTDATLLALKEIFKEFDGYAGNSPATAEELQKYQINRTLRLPGKYETNSALLADLSQQVALGRPDDYLNTWADKINALRLRDIRNASKNHLNTKRWIWVIVGDLEKIEKDIRSFFPADKVSTYSPVL